MKLFHLIIPTLFFVFAGNQVVFAKNKWSLKTSTKRLNEISFELQASKKDVEVFKEKLNGAAKWPNPSVEINSSNRLGIEDGNEGYEPTSIKFSQPLPFGRLSRQKAVSAEELEEAKSNAALTKLQLEHSFSLGFHEVQHRKAIFEIAKQKLKLINRVAKRKSKRGSLVRFLNPLDKSRLQIIKNDFFVEVELAEGEYKEVLARLKNTLQIPHETNMELVELGKTPRSPSLKDLQLSQKNHPLLMLMNHKIKAAKMLVKLEKSKRFDDPVLSVFAEEDFLENKRQNFWGASVSLKIPLWDTNSSSIAGAKANADKYSYTLRAKKLELETDLNQGHKHLGHLISLGNKFENKMLPQSKAFLNLAVKNFSIGESGILSLIDAYNNYYGARLQHLKTLKEAWDELAEVRLAANKYINEAK